MVHIFIVNNFSGSGALSKSIRSQLSNRKDIKYFIFTTIESGKEADVATRVLRYFQGERIRFYACGGSGTFRNILNAIGDFSKVEIAFFPCGLTNDFLKIFGDKEKLFLDLNALIDGQSVPIDYIKTNHGLALNSFSLGVDTRMLQMMDKLRIFNIFGAQVPYNLSTFLGVITSVPRRLIFNIDDTELTANFSEIMITNGTTLGGNMHVAKSPLANDNKAAYFYTTDKKGVMLLPCFFGLMNADYKLLNKHSFLGEASSFELCSVDGMPIAGNLDGEYILGSRYWTIKLVKEGLNFVIPAGLDFAQHIKEMEAARNESLY